MHLIITNNHLGAENSLLYPSFLELRNLGGNVCKQLEQWNTCMDDKICPV